MDFVMTPELIMAVSFVVRDVVQTLLQNLEKMSPAEREVWRLEQMQRKAEHDAWLARHLSEEG